MTTEVQTELWKIALPFKCPSCGASQRKKCITRSQNIAMEPHAARLSKGRYDNAPKPRKAKRKLPTVPKGKRKPKDPRGGVSKYKREFDDLAFKLCTIGAIDKELAEAFDISTTTLDTWKRNEPTFAAQIRAGKLIADAEVGNALYHRALGTTIEEWRESRGEDGNIETLKTTKQIPGDVTAQKFWLKNRRPDQFKENIAEIGGTGGAFSLIIHEELRPPKEKDITPKKE